MMAQSRKYLKIGPYGVAAGCAIGFALCVRVVLLSMGWPATNSDEATMGLMARHIAYKGEHPVFIYGQNYMGSLEAHIGAMFFWLFGPSLFWLRLSVALLYTAFLVAMYLLTRLLYSRRLALAVTVFLSFGSIELLTRQLKAVGGAAETLLFGTLVLLCATWLVFSFQEESVTRFGRRRRWLLYGCYGLATGLGMWSHLLVLPFVVSSLALLLFFCYREVRVPVIAAFLVGFLLGFFPSLSFNVQHPAQNSLGALWQLHSSGGTSAKVPFTLWDQLRGTFLVSLPVATGANPQCQVSDIAGVWRTHITPCLLGQGVWGVGFLLLYGLVLLFTLLMCAKYARQSRASALFAGDRRAMRSHFARLALLLSGGLTLLSYLLSPAPALVPITSTRYLVGLLVLFPVLLAPLLTGTQRLYAGLRTPQTRRISPGLLSAICSATLVLFLYANALLALVGVFWQVPTIQATNQQQQKMVNDLLHSGVTRLYSDYWTCNRIIFQSNERLICSVLNEQLQLQDNRYVPYQTLVEHDVHASYVFHVGSPQALALEKRLTQTGRAYTRQELDGYEVYTLDA